MSEPHDLPERTTLDIPELAHDYTDVTSATDVRGTSGHMVANTMGLERMHGVEGDETVDDTLVEVEDLPRERVTRQLPRLRLPRMLALRRVARPTVLLVPTPFRRGWTRWAWLAVLLALVVTLIVVVLRTRAPEIQTAKVTSGNLTLSFTTAGKLQSASYDANFTGSGKIAEIDVTVGQQVNQGTPLAKLDNTQLQDALNEAQSAVSSAQTQLSDAQAAQQRVQAKTAAQVAAAYDQEQSAINGCHTGDSACVQRAEDTYAAAQAQADAENANAQSAVDAAQATVSAAQAKAQTAQDSLNGATLSAPHSGTIAAINGTVGSTVVGSNATAPVTPFIVIADLGALQVATSVSVANVGAVAADNPVQFTVSSFGNQVFQGKVDGVSPIAQQSGAVPAYPMTIDVDMQSVQNAHLFPGMAANITVTTQQRFGVKLIPASAVAFARAAGDPKQGGFLTRQQVTSALAEARQMQLDAQANGADDSADNPTPGYVLQRSGDKWIVKPVILGLTDGVSYEVLDGLSVGDSVVKGEVNGPVTVPTPTAATHS